MSFRQIHKSWLLSKEKKIIYHRPAEQEPQRASQKLLSISQHKARLPAACRSQNWTKMVLLGKWLRWFESVQTDLQIWVDFSGLELHHRRFLATSPLWLPTKSSNSPMCLPTSCVWIMFRDWHADLLKKNSDFKEVDKPLPYKDFWFSGQRMWQKGWDFQQWI